MKAEHLPTETKENVENVCKKLSDIAERFFLHTGWDGIRCSLPVYVSVSEIVDFLPLHTTRINTFLFLHDKHTRYQHDQSTRWF